MEARRWETGDGKLAYECPIVFVDWFVALIYIVIMILCRCKKIFIIVAVLVVEGKRRYTSCMTRVFSVVCPRV